MEQFCVTPSMGKRLIGRAMAQHPSMLRALEGGTVVIVAGTTNGYVAEEVLRSLGQEEGFTRAGFRRGIVSAPGGQVPGHPFPGDVVIQQGVWQQGLTIFDVDEDLKQGDLVLKGGNALDPYGQAGVLMAHPQGGTILAAIRAEFGRRVELIVPIGLEKRVPEDINTLAARSVQPGVRGPRLYPILGDTFTEIDAVELLTGAEALLLAAGGVYGAEGALWLAVDGTDEQVKAAGELFRTLAGESLCLA